MTILNVATKFDFSYIAKRSKKRTDIAGVALFPITLDEEEAPAASIVVRNRADPALVWSERGDALLHRHQLAEEIFAQPDGTNPLFVDISTYRKTVVLDDAFLFGLREIVDDGRIAGAAEAQRVASTAISAPDGIHAVSSGAFFTLDFTIDRERKMSPAVSFRPVDGGRGSLNLSGCFPIPLLDDARRLAQDLGWTVTAPFEVESTLADDKVEAMLVRTVEALCEELVGAAMPNRNSSNFSVGHLESFLRYTDPERPPTFRDLTEIIATIELDSDRGDYTNPTGEKVLKSTLRNRLMHAVLEEVKPEPAMHLG